MIKLIGKKKVELNDDEYEYYLELCVKLFKTKDAGSKYMDELIETDDNGFITVAKMSSDTPTEMVFFIQNIIINQRLSAFDQRIAGIELFIEKIGRGKK
jgi:hypothetical protein